MDKMLRVVCILSLLTLPAFPARAATGIDG